jgi:hypothetical protein
MTNLAIALVDLGKRDRGIELLELAVATDPELVIARELLDRVRTPR